MAAKEIIAIAGATGKAGAAIANQLAKYNYRLLLISRNKDKLATLLHAIQRTFPNADVEAVDCLKDGCWEADIIVLAVPVSVEKEVAERIKEVATQKLIARFVNQPNTPSDAKRKNELQQLLPYSKIVEVIVNDLTQQTLIDINEVAVQSIVNIIAEPTFNTSSTNSEKTKNEIRTFN
jgi:8-hydroxy-5-deazaflavin:NADPH oxidoreductase